MIRGQKKQDLLCHFLKCCVCLMLVWFLFLCFSYSIAGDEKEHLYASFLITLGEVPYRDFFEHHHPLLWYVFSPIVLLFSNNENVLYMMRLFGFLIVFGQIYYIYKITFYITKCAKSSLLAVLSYLLMPAVQDGAILFRPDSLMMLFYMAGFFYYLIYRDVRNIKFLWISFVLFFLSFMCLQKILISLFFLLFVFLSDVLKKNVNIKDFLVVGGGMIVLYLCYLMYLYYNNSLKDYWEINWILNSKIRYTYSIVPVVRWIEIFLFVLVAGGVLWVSKNECVKVIAIFGIVLAVLLYFFKIPYVHYFLLVYPYFAIVLGCMCARFSKEVLYGVGVGIICWWGFNLYKIVNIYPKKPYDFVDAVKLEKIILLNSDENDGMVGCEDLTYGTSLRKNVVGYYWFNYVHIVQLDNKIFNRHELPMLNKTVKEKMPKIVCGGDWGDCLNDKLEMTTPCKTWQVLDKEWLKSYYSPVGSFYVRRD